MALINCPECGKQVSTNAAQCVHCGSKFTYCPECKTVAAGANNACPTCGYKFNSNISRPIREEINAELSETSEYDLLKAWQNSMPNDKKLLTGFKYARIILSIASVLMLVIAAILLITWQNTSDPLDKIAGVKDLKSGMQTLIAIACILEIADFLFDYTKDSFIKIRCGNWINKQNIDCVEYINETIKNRGRQYVMSSKEEDEIELFHESVYISENPSVKQSLYVGMIIRAICATVLMICVGVCLMENVEELIRAGLYKDKFNLKYTTLIGAGILGAIYLVFVITTSFAYNKKYNAWTEKYLTAYKEYEQK